MDIFTLISASDIVINKLTLILKIIGQYNIKYITEKTIKSSF